MDDSQLLSRITALERLVEDLRHLLVMKVLGNDISTNYGINTGQPKQANILSYQLNGVQTTVDNAVDPVTLNAASLKSLDVASANGDYSLVDPFQFALLHWDGAAYQICATLKQVVGDAQLRLVKIGTSNVALIATGGGGGVPFISLANGTHTVVVGSGHPLSLDGVDVLAANGDVTVPGNLGGTHAQNLGPLDSPTFSNLTTTAGALNTVLASLQSQINAKPNHGDAVVVSVTGTADLVTGAVTGTGTGTII